MTIVTHNIGDSNGRVVPVRTTASLYASSTWPDVFVLQELRSQGHLLGLRRAAVQLGSPEYNFAFSPTLGIAILARGRLTEPRELVAPSPSGCYGAFGTTVRTAAGPIDIVGVHLAPVRKSRKPSGYSAAWKLLVQLGEEVVLHTPRARSVDQVTAWLSRWSENPTVVAGDFNTIAASTAIRSMRRSFRDALRGTADSRTGTYWKIHGPKPRVDYIFHSDHLIRGEAYVIRRKAGDHYPVRARFQDWCRNC